MGLRFLLAVSLLFGACSYPTRASTPPPDASSSSSPSGGSGPGEPKGQATNADDGNEPGTASWIDAVRREQWRLAAERLDALESQRQQQPELRYIRARVAIELGDAKTALSKLEGLEADLELLAKEIRQHRAEMQLEAGPYEVAAAYFAKRGDAESMLAAARAWHKAGKPKQARAQVARALRQKRKRRRAKPSEIEIEARALRARLALETGKKSSAALDLKWLALRAPGHAAAADADQQYARVSGKALSKQERLRRAKHFSAKHDVDAVENELELMGKAPGAAPSKVDIVRLRAFAYYRSRRDYLLASKLFEECAKLDKRQRPKDLFYAARALARAGQDETAIKLYRSYVKKYPASGFTEAAYYLLGRLPYTIGQWQIAETAHTEYLRRYGKRRRGRFEEEARYEQALARLALGKYKQALASLEHLHKQERGARVKVRLLHLKGVALQQLEKLGEAKATFKQVIEERPLSFVALAARERLKGLGVSEVAPIAPPSDPKAAPPLTVKLPRKVLLLSRLGLSADAERELLSVADSFQKRHKDRGGEALCRAYGQLDVADQRYRLGQRLIRSQALMVAPSAATRWAWECIYPEPYAKIVGQVAREVEVEEPLIYAVMRQESAFRAEAVSSAQAKGLMQLIGPTARAVARELGVPYEADELESPSVNIRFGAYYLSKVRRRFGGRVALAAAAYNAGPQAVSRWLEQGEDLSLDVWVNHIPYLETREYVSRVFGNWARYRYLRGGAAALPPIDLSLPKGLRAAVDDY